MTGKYKLREDDTLDHNGIKLYRIEALSDVRDGVPAGTLGGYLTSEFNLSQEGSCWVYRGSKVVGDAQVRGDALVREHCMVMGDAIIRDNAVVHSSCQIFGNVEISEDTVVPEESFIYNMDVLRSSSFVLQGTSHFAFMYRIGSQMQHISINAEGLSLNTTGELALLRDGDGLACFLHKGMGLRTVQRNQRGGFLNYGKALEELRRRAQA